MRKGILTIVFLSLQLLAGAQNSWLSYLHSIKKEFYYKDTIIVNTKAGDTINPVVKLHGIQFQFSSTDTNLALQAETERNNQKLFSNHEDTLASEGNGKYFYSFYLSKNNYATLVLCSEGMWGQKTNLYLYNFSPTGQLLKQVKLQDEWGDAGESYYTKTKFENDSVFKVIHGDGFEKPDQGYYYKVSEYIYVIRDDGRILRKSKRIYIEKASDHH